jgi:glycosyltransferase involved in cell wall biosynthesis
MKDKKLIYILNSYKHSDTTHFFHVLNLLEAIANTGTNVILIIEKGDDKPNFKNKSIKVQLLKNKGYRRFLELFLILRRLNKTQKSSTFIRITSITACLSVLSSIGTSNKVFFWQSGTTHEWDWERPFSLNKIKWFFKSYVPSYLARKSVDRFVTGPQYMVDYYSDVVGVKKEKIRLLYNDIDVNRFQLNECERMSFKESFVKQYPIVSGKRIVLLVHKMSPVRKTTLYVPDAIKTAYSTHKDTVFVIVGAGKELPEIKDLVKSAEMNNRFLFLGPLENRIIQKLYSISTLFIHPTYNEGFPRVILETMAAGLPFVSTDAGGTLDITPAEQHRYISDKRDVELFSKNLTDLLGDDEKMKGLRSVNKKYVMQFDTKVIASMYNEVLFGEH